MLYPLRFQPVFRQYLWGGRRLGEMLGKPIGETGRYAESWELVDHGSDQSVVANGSLQGQTLASLLESHGELLLGKHSNGNQFPLLLKYLDCNRVLSVQVHPDDAYARAMSPPDYGKTEAWYVVAADAGAVIYAGLKSGVGPTELRAACQAGATDEVLHALHPKPGDCVFIPAGTVHALGAGLMVAEIQQSSDTTFRLFDWNRVDDEGRSRPLHVAQAIDVTDYDRGPIEFQRPHRLGDGVGERLVECDKFLLDRFEGTQMTTVGDDDRFHIITVVSGSVSFRWDDEASTSLALGETALLPAAIGAVEISGNSDDATFLRMCLPKD